MTDVSGVYQQHITNELNARKQAQAERQAEYTRQSKGYMTDKDGNITGIRQGSDAEAHYWNNINATKYARALSNKMDRNEIHQAISSSIDKGSPRQLSATIENNPNLKKNFQAIGVHSIRAVNFKTDNSLLADKGFDPASYNNEAKQQKFHKNYVVAKGSQGQDYLLSYPTITSLTAGGSNPDLSDKAHDAKMDLTHSLHDDDNKSTSYTSLPEGEYKDNVVKVAKKFGVDPNLLYNVQKTAPNKEGYVVGDTNATSEMLSDTAKTLTSVKNRQGLVKQYGEDYVADLDMRLRHNNDVNSKNALSAYDEKPTDTTDSDTNVMNTYLNAKTDESLAGSGETRASKAQQLQNTTTTAQSAKANADANNIRNFLSEEQLQEQAREAEVNARNPAKLKPTEKQKELRTTEQLKDKTTDVYNQVVTDLNKKVTDSATSSGRFSTDVRSVAKARNFSEIDPTVLAYVGTKSMANIVDTYHKLNKSSVLTGDALDTFNNALLTDKGSVDFIKGVTSGNFGDTDVGWLDTKMNNFFVNDLGMKRPDTVMKDPIIRATTYNVLAMERANARKVVSGVALSDNEIVSFAEYMPDAFDAKSLVGALSAVAQQINTNIAGLKALDNTNTDIVSRKIEIQPALVRLQGKLDFIQVIAKGVGSGKNKAQILKDVQNYSKSLVAKVIKIKGGAYGSLATNNTDGSPIEQQPSLRGQ